MPRFWHEEPMQFRNEVEGHYAQLLGIGSPWEVRQVDLDLEGKRVDIEIGWKQGHKGICSACGGECSIYDHAEERQWRHLDTMQFETVLRCRVPRTKCPKDGIKVMRVPWAGPGSRFTCLFERFAIDVIGASRSLTQAGEILRLSWDQLHAIMERAVERGLERRSLEKVEYVGMDEKSFLRGQSYVSLLTDLGESRVLEVTLGRDSEAADVLWATLSAEQRQQIKAVAMDMSQAYISSALRAVPDADVVHDKYHVSASLNGAVAKVHRQENRDLQREGNDVLKGTRQWFLFGEENLPKENQEAFSALKGMFLKVGRAWSIKEAFSRFWELAHQSSARRFFKNWFDWASRSQLKPIIEVAKMLKRHFEHLVTYIKHPITNAVTEGLNSKIQTIKSNARGFRSFFNYRIRILFFCGKLSLHP